MVAGGMPKHVDGMAGFTAEAAAAAIVSRLGPQAKRLSTELLARYPLRHLHTGWQIPVAFEDETRRLNVLLPIAAPFRPPLLALAEPPPKLTWPHVEDDGVLCLLPETSAVDYTRPVDVLDNLLGQAAELIETCLGPNRDDEFRREFVPYWTRACEKNISCISLLHAEPPSRVVRIWRTELNWIIGEDEDTLLRWMRNRFGPTVKTIETSEAPFVWLNRPMVPSEFPSDGSQLKKLLRHADSAAFPVVTKLIDEDFRHIPVILGAASDNGACLAAVALRRRPRSTVNRRSDMITHGFRPGHIPRSLVVERALSHTSTISRIPVERADADWVHNRGQDERIRMLSVSKVIVVGCGSLGAPVATHLAMAGVGHFALFDPEILTWPNTGRHPLGAAQVGANKAEALSEEMRKRFPHVSTLAVPKRWQDATEWRAAIDGCSLIVSATGDWGSEAALNVWALTADQPIPVVYGWTEAHACAGQAVCVVPGGSCLQCGFQTDGKPRVVATAWSVETTKQEPGCGTAFQPYGPVEFSHVVALVSELALESLLNRRSISTHRVWLGATDRLRELNGTWDSGAIQTFGDPGSGERIVRRDWVVDSNCPVCASP
jgi:molybdopterin/thiamine biosynthesis adenylyltransferase